MWETWVQSLGWEDPLEKGKATHSSMNSMDYSSWGYKEQDMTEQLSQSDAKLLNSEWNTEEKVFKLRFLSFKIVAGSHGPGHYRI